MWQRLRHISVWHFVWICIVGSELLTLASNSVLSLLWWGHISRDLLLIGSIDAFLVALILAPVGILFIRHVLALADRNALLRQEVELRCQAEAALRESEERYRVIFERSGDANFILEGQGEGRGRVLWANQAAADMHGYTMEELKRLRITDLDSPEGSSLAGPRMERMLAGEWLSFEVDHQRKDGSLFPVEVSAGLAEFGGHPYIVAFDRDITTRRQSEAALRESEERFRKFADEASFDGIIVHDQGRILDVSQTFASMNGYQREELIGRDALDTVAPECRELVRSHIQAGHEQLYEAISLRKDGSRFPIEIRARNIAFGGKTVRTAAVRDISERKRAEEELRQSERRYRSLVENVPYGLFIADVATGRLLFVNQQVCDLFALTLERAQGLTIWDVTDPGDH